MHPRYLDSKGLVALWREALLAQRALQGGARGYGSHPQLERFKAHPSPAAMIAAYLLGVWREAESRGYGFDRNKVVATALVGQVEETDGQLKCEWAHLLAKLEARAPERWEQLRLIEVPEAHPLFTIVPGERRAWERS